MFIIKLGQIELSFCHPEFILHPHPFSQSHLSSHIAQHTHTHTHTHTHIHTHTHTRTRRVFQDRASIHTHGCPGTNSVDLVGLELRLACRCLPSAQIKGKNYHCPVNTPTDFSFIFYLVLVAGFNGMAHKVRYFLLYAY